MAESAQAAPRLGPVDVALRVAAAQGLSHEQPEEMGPERPQSRHRVLRPGKREERPAVERVAAGDPVVVGDEDEGIPGLFVHPQELFRAEAAVGLGGVAVQLDFAVVAGDGVGIADLDRHAWGVRAPTGEPYDAVSITATR